MFCERTPFVSCILLFCFLLQYIPFSFDTLAKQNDIYLTVSTEKWFPFMHNHYMLLCHFLFSKAFSVQELLLLLLHRLCLYIFHGSTNATKSQRGDAKANTMWCLCAIRLYVLYCLHYLFWYDLKRIRRDLNTKQC